jgi:creatinine amidohydrolase
MQWLELRSGEFEEAVRASARLCLLPMGCLERHGRHLPAGTDQIVADEVCRQAAEREPAVVFPPYYFGQIAEARHYPGAFSLPHDLLLRLIKATLAEIARNGFEKILIVNGHGGNNSFLGYLMMSLLQEPHPYVAYAHFLTGMEPEDRKRWEEMKETEEDGHAGERETSTVLHLRPELVHLDELGDPAEGRSRERQRELEGTQNPMGWYARYPTHLAGHPRAASAEKGRFLIEARVRRLVNVMRAIKADEVTPELQREFHSAAEHPTAPRE